jgi:hypothetical protein
MSETPEEKPLNKSDYDQIKKVAISEDGRAVIWDVINVEESGEFTDHVHSPGVHQKVLTVHIKRECDGND